MSVWRLRLARLAAVGSVSILMCACNPQSLATDTSDGPSSGTRWRHDSASETFDELRSLAAYLGDVETRESWSERLTDEGLEPSDAQKTSWELSDDTGEFLTTAEFSSDEVVYYLWFTPRNPSPLPDALLSHLLSASTQTELDSQRTRLAFPGHVKNARGNCEIEQGLLVSFSGSVEEVSETVSCQPE